MSFGLLGSIIPQVNRNEVFYTSEDNKLSIGKVSVSNKNYNPSKVRLGITTDDINIEYLEYNRFVNYGETFETETLYLGHGQKLVVRSNVPNVNFLFYGKTTNDTVNSVKSGLLNSILSTNNTKKILYVGPENYNANVTLSICNLDSLPSKARIGIANSSINSFDSSEYIEYDVEIGPNQTYTRTEIKLDEFQTLVCSSSEDSNLSFVCYGYLQLINGAGEFVIDASNQNITFNTVNVTDLNVTNTQANYQNVFRGVINQLNVTGIATVNNFNNTGIGTVSRLNVTGIATVNNFNNTGIGTINVLKFTQVSGQIGTHILGFSTDNTFSQYSDQNIPTEAATRYYIDNSVAISSVNSKIYTYFFSQS
jgi:hypothetical protein